MGRLIDADALMKDIVSRFGCRPYIEVGNKCEYIHEIINKQPTAFDVEEVVAQLEHDLPFIEADDGGGIFVNQIMAIDAIRKGGVKNE